MSRNHKPGDTILPESEPAAEPSAETQPANRLPPTNGEAHDPFDDLGSLRLTQDFQAELGVQLVITSVPVRKPNRHEWVRVRPGEEWYLETALFIDKSDREVYLIAPAMRSTLLGEITPVALFLAVSRQSPLPFVWPCQLPGQDGRQNPWHESAIKAALHAQKRWVRVAADMSAGRYQLYEASPTVADPTWPEMPFNDLLRLAFSGRLIKDPDHPVLKRLRGES